MRCGAWAADVATAPWRRGPAPGSREDERALRALARSRTRIALGLTGAVFAVYFGFILAVAFAREALGRLLVPGLSVGIALGASVIVVAWLLTWTYVRWANGRYDAALRALRERE